MAKPAGKKRNKYGGEALTLVPLYLFTLLFLVGPLVYMVVLSFLTQADTWGVVPEFTLENYAAIGEPVYLETFWESLKLAVITTVLVIGLGYPFGYFMAKLGPKWKRRTMLLLMIPFWTSSLIRLYGWIIIFRAGGVFDTLLTSLHITSEPLKLLYTYPAVVVGMVYALLPFMIFAVYSSAEKLDFSLVEAARDLGANSATVFRKVIFPLSLPGILSGVTMVFVPAVSTFAISRLLGGGTHMMLGDLIEQQFLGGAYNPHLGSAIALVMMVIVIICMGIMNRFGEGEEQAVLL